MEFLSLWAKWFLILFCSLGLFIGFLTLAIYFMKTGAPIYSILVAVSAVSAMVSGAVAYMEV